MIRIFAATIATLLLALPAQAFETQARAAYVVDQTTGTVLLTGPSYFLIAIGVLHKRFTKLGAI